MHARFIAAVVTGLAGGFVVTASQAFSPGTTAWLAFGVGLALLVVAAFPVLFGERGIAGVTLDAQSGVPGPEYSPGRPGTSSRGWVLGGRAVTTFSSSCVTGHPL
jgi:hypothetical protein